MIQIWAHAHEPDIQQNQMGILRPWFHNFQKKLIGSEKINSSSNGIVQVPTFILFSTVFLNTWLYLLDHRQIRVLHPRNLPAPSFGQIFVGFHYDNTRSNLVGLDKQTFTVLNEHIILSFRKEKNMREERMCQNAWLRSLRGMFPDRGEHCDAFQTTYYGASVIGKVSVAAH